MDIRQIQDEIIAEFNLFAQWTDKYEYLIELGKNLPPMNAAHKIEENLIRGCMSQVWLRAELQNGKVAFAADSDAVITKGIIALLIRVLNQQAPRQVAAADLYFIDAIGLREHLSATRANGLRNMVQQIKATGKNFSAAH